MLAKLVRNPFDTPLFGVSLWLWALDTAVTLLGQPAAYWAGDRAALVELNPLVVPILHAGPGWFVAGAMAYAALYGVLVGLVGRRLGACVAFAATVGHFLGAGGWLLCFGPVGWLVLAAVIVLVKRSLDARGPNPSLRITGARRTSAAGDST